MPHRSPIRGRTSEASAIAEYLTTVARGPDGPLILRGGDGSGVTRMLDDTRRRALACGLRVGFTTASAGDRLVPLGQLTAAVEDATTPGMGERRAGYQALLATRRRLCDLSDTTPVLLCFDDFQLGDPESFAGLRHLAAELAGRPIGWVLGMRGHAWPRELGATWAALERQGARQVSLGALTPAAVEQIAEDRLGRPAGPALRTVLAQASGNPGLVVAVLDGLQEEGQLRVGADAAEQLPSELPARVRDVVRDRLQPLSAEAHVLLRAVAVLGSSCTFAHVTAMLGSGSCALLAPLDELVRSGVLATVDDRIVVVEPLLGQAAVATLAPPLRRALQRQAADVLVTEGGQAAEIAAHLVASAGAGRTDAAAALLDATRSLRALDPVVAATVGDQLLDRVDRHDPLYATIATEAAVLHHGAGRPEHAATIAQAAFAGPMSDETAGRLHARLATADGVTGPGQVRAAREALARAGLSPALERRLRVTLLVGLAGSGEVDEAARVARAVLADEQAAGDTLDEDAARRAHALAVMAYVDGAYDTGLAHLRATEARAPLSDASRALVELARSEALSMRQPPDAALAISSARVLWARGNGQAVAERRWCGLRGRQLLHAGRLEETIEVLGRLFASDPRTRGSEDAAALIAFARAAAHLGRSEAVEAARDQARRAVADPSPEVRRQSRWLLAVISGGPSDERPATPELPRSPADAGHPAQLVRMARPAAVAERAVAIAEQRRDRTPASALLAAAAQHTRGLLARDPVPVEAAAGRLAALGRPLDAAAAFEDAAALWADERAASAAWRSAHGLWSASGATVDAARVHDRMAAPGPWHGLTAAERSVAELVATGLGNRAVAGRLAVSPHTVDDHLRSVYAKLGVRSRVQLIRLRHGE